MEDYVDRGLEALAMEKWARRSPEERKGAVMAAVYRQLKKIGVPRVKADLVALAPTTHGQFIAGDWRLQLNQRVFYRDVLPLDVAVELLDTVYHEVRHAEQWFRIARWLAGLGRTAAQIQAELGIKKMVAEAATRKPLRGRGLEVAEAHQWYEALRGRYAQAHDRVLANLRRQREAYQRVSKALGDLRRDPQAGEEELERAQNELERVREAHRKVIAAYRRLPDEADAFRLGDAVALKCRRRKP